MRSVSRKAAKGAKDLERTDDANELGPPGFLASWRDAHRNCSGWGETRGGRFHPMAPDGVGAREDFHASSHDWIRSISVNSRRFAGIPGTRSDSSRAMKPLPV